MSAPLLDRIDALCADGSDADDVLRGVVQALTDEPAVAFAEIRFVEEGRLVAGPSAGAPDEARRHVSAVDYRGGRVGELVVDGELAAAALRHVAEAISTYVLLGWDTGGTTWEP
ncbi:MAG TPA: hypothetical protein VEH79_01705 [Gaiellaceae bacterium]|nr:hypothetical protein [Gaiellaceae bacterium]